MTVHLSKRMMALANMVSMSNRLCDVGCDHGYLPIYLVSSGAVPSAIAADIGEGPLQAAGRNIAREGLEDRIATRQTDGLCGIMPEEADSLLIAGMGGGLVIHILSNGRRTAQAMKEVILQPQSEVDQVRRFLWEEGYCLLDEDMVFEDGKYYPMMKVCYDPENQKECKALDEKEFLFGRLLLERKHPVLKDYLLRESGIQQQVLERLKEQRPTEAICQRIREKENYLRLVEDCLW